MFESAPEQIAREVTKLLTGWAYVCPCHKRFLRTCNNEQFTTTTRNNPTIKNLVC